MKYLITESQLDKVIFRYLEKQNFIQVNQKYRIYFVKSEDDDFAQIRYDKEDSWCGINPVLIDKISSFFSLDTYDCIRVIGKWVENTIQMNVADANESTSLYFV